ncbi:MAG: sporulation integral membrane protein YtvI [Bacillota bacterium]
MHFKLEKYKKTVTSVITILLIILVIYMGATFLFAFLAPFIIAVVISLINEPIINYMEKKMRINRKYASVLSLVLTVSIITFLIVLIVLKVYYELIRLQNNLPQYIETISNTISGYYDRASVFYDYFPDNISASLEDNFKSNLPKVEKIITSIAASILNSITSIPKIAVFTTVTLLSSYFISSDRRNIRNFVYKQLPGNFKKGFPGVKSEAGSAILGYFRAQLVLMSITFIQSTLGFIIIKADYAVLMGFIVALSDGIPILGTGIIMLPWIAWSFITGNMKMACGLASVYLSGLIIRQVIEPKIVAAHTGLHPLVTLISMYMGLMLFGVIGLFIGPLFAILLKSLQKSGVISLWND